MSEEVAVTEEVVAKTSIAHKAVGIAKEASLKLLVESNPKRPGSSAFDRFEGYFKEGSDTVQGALDNGLTMGDVKYDLIHSFIDVDGASVEEYEVTARGTRAKKSSNVDEDLMGVGDSVGILSNDDEDVLN